MSDILKSGIEQVTKQVEATAPEQLNIELTPQEMEVSINKELGRGWSVAAWMRAQYTKFTEAEYGARITKTWGALRFK